MDLFRTAEKMFCSGRNNCTLKLAVPVETRI